MENKEFGKIYLVATPIGNLRDMSFRAIETLKNVDLIAAEDTRQSLKLLNYYNISKPLVSYHRHNEDVKTEGLINKVKEGKNIAIITDAGTPGISDPGEVIVKQAINESIDVVPIPGACALINALICSGLDTREFSFYGFLPINKKLRKNKIEEIKNEEKTTIIYEAPHRIMETLKELEEKIGDANIVVARELTKIHEEFIRGKISEVIQKIKPKGEFIILIEGTKKEKENELNSLTLEEHYKYYENKGFTKKEIIKKIAKDRGVNKNEIYQFFVNDRK